MNAVTDIKPAPCTCSRVADMMVDEKVLRIKRWLGGWFSVELEDGRVGSGNTPREAIDDAQSLKVAA